MTKKARSSTRGTVKQAVKQHAGQPSVFEKAVVARKRHAVVGTRTRTGRSAMQARARSDQLRRETLLIEHQQKGRTNAFVDGRFGEDDQAMPLEDKLVHRFQRERQRQLKQSRYSLEDEGGGGGMLGGALGAPSELTHGGRALGDMEEMSDLEGDSDDEGGGRGGKRREDGFAGADFVKKAHFGGGEDAESDGRRLSAKELLEETIAKYKLAKYERQEEKMAQVKEIDALDAEFDAIRGLVFETGSKRKQPAQPAAVTSSLAADRAGRAGGPSAHADFEQIASELAREMRAAPTDRLQTESELAAHEAKRLKLLESDRLKRMQPDGAGSGGVAVRRTDDDLVDDFGPLPGDLPSDDDEEEAEEGEEEEV